MILFAQALTAHSSLIQRAAREVPYSLRSTADEANTQKVQGQRRVYFCRAVRSLQHRMGTDGRWPEGAPYAHVLCAEPTAVLHRQASITLGFVLVPLHRIFQRHSPQLCAFGP